MDKHMEMSRLYFTLCGLHFFVRDVFFFNFLSKLKYLGYAHQYLDKSEPDLFRFQLRKFYNVCMTLRSLKILLVVYYVFGR